MVDDAIRFASNKSKDTARSASSNDKEEESNGPDYDEDEDQLEEVQEHETGEMTINQVF